ncbi:uncharacterized protein RAG0_07422 [Rhynchosporium agropyri]|uniref:Uncharacterized protein n=1 Tax=Rhynchosporium agropyri TaxID=914238 RepID=A0A1E1KLE8_9HELO|nr:uncharacterized protein RAG0_07422 [Rhynchosporium agropyri]
MDRITFRTPRDPTISAYYDMPGPNSPLEQYPGYKISKETEQSFAANQRETARPGPMKSQMPQDVAKFLTDHNSNISRNDGYVN